MPKVPDVSEGSHFPLGATVKPDGVNFALFSQNAKEVSLHLFRDPAGPPERVVRMEARTKYVWHAFVKGLKPGQLYGYRVLGDFDPAGGARYNGSKLLLDPYA
jgi:isoamylase